MTDYKQLCAELLDALESYMDWSNAEELKSRARTALAEPEPEGPTDEELFAAAEAYAEDNGLIGLHNAPDFARAVLARWGNHPESPDSSLQPVPEGPTDEPMIPDHYRGDDIRVYREGFHAGYKYAFQLMEKHSDV